MHRPMLQPSRAAAVPMLCAVAVFVVAAALWPAPAVAAPNAEDPLASALADTVRLAVVPTPMAADAGDTVLVEYTVPVAGPAFNAYDAYLAYDPAVLQFLPAANVSTQEGPLMTTACGLRFHVFQADTLAGRLRTSHSLMCAGRSVTGPGVLYRVRFRCRDVDADTPLTLLVTSPHKTEFYFAGTIVSPLATISAMVRVGAGNLAPAPLPTPRLGLSDLRAAPNPFNPRTTITFEVAPSAVESAGADVTVHSLDGRLVRRLWSGTLTPGTWTGEWDGRDDAGRDVAAGIYLVRAHAGDSFTGGRVALVR
ncbi:MAG: hypothetical protein IPI48_09630 [bacterium]|nr:hypothetical protein [bacterium]